VARRQFADNKDGGAGILMCLDIHGKILIIKTMAKPRRANRPEPNNVPVCTLDPATLEYRGRLQEMGERMQKAYDSTVVALSGAAMGLSLTFYKDVAGPHPCCKDLLLRAWIFWGFSILFILISYFTSINALSKAVDQVDADETENLGGTFDRLTKILSIAGGVFLMLGIIYFTVFVAANFK